MSVVAGEVDNAGTRLAYLAAGERGRPLLLCPGLSDSAEDYREVLEALAPQRAIAMSFRGQAGSGEPESGYDLNDFASDIGAVVDGLDLHDVALFAHSRAVPYAIAYAADQPGRVGTLVLGDAPAVHRSYPEEWAEGFAATDWRGQQVADRISGSVLRQVQREAGHVELWATLAQLPTPTVAILGGLHGADVVDDLTSRFQQAGAEVIVFEDAGHALWSPDFDRFVRVLRQAAERR